MDSAQRSVTVIGAGYVGLVTGLGLARLGHRVEIVETRADRLTALQRGRVPIHEAGLQEALDELLGARLTISPRPVAQPDVVMICVGTPIGADGRSDLSQLQAALASLAGLLTDEVPLVVRSTLPPGSTRRVVEWSGVPERRVFSNPEFLRQGTAFHDFLAPTRIVIGHFPDASPAMIELVVGLFDGVEAPRLIVDVAAAELIKNGANAFLALKLSFTNEIAAMCEAYGTDVDRVLAGITLDPRIGSQYMRPSFGFGGSCLPKELQALAVAGQDAGLEMQVTVAAAAANVASRARFVETIDAASGGLAGRTIGLLGLAFKAGTDDVRDSPALSVAERLMARGAHVRAHDPAAGPNALAVLPELEIVDDPLVALAGADVGVVATEWPLYRTLPWEEARTAMARPLIVDGRRIVDADALRAMGYEVVLLGTATEASVTARSAAD